MLSSLPPEMHGSGHHLFCNVGLNCTTTDSISLNFKRFKNHSRLIQELFKMSGHKQRTAPPAFPPVLGSDRRLQIASPSCRHSGKACSYELHCPGQERLAAEQSPAWPRK